MDTVHNLQFINQTFRIKFFKEHFLHRNSIREERGAIQLFEAKIPKYQATSCHIP
jgi:hypothetical protein